MAIRDLVYKLLRRKSESAGFEWSADSQGISFISPDGDLKSLSRGNGDRFTLTQYSQLRALEEQGLAEAYPDGFEIPTELAVQLDNEVRSLLELPAPFPGHFKTEIKGLSTQAEFSLKILPALSEVKVFHAYETRGSILRITDSTQYLLTPPELIAFRALEQHDQTKGLRDDEQRNLTLLAELQRAKKHGLNLELAAFDTIEIISPEKVSLILEKQEDGGLLLLPNYGDTSLAGDVAERLGQLNRDSTVGSLRVRDKRIVLDEARFKATLGIIDNQHVAPEQVQSFIKNPAAYLDAALIELNEGFSTRVKGIVEFQKHYFGATDESEIDWFASRIDSTPAIVKPDKLETLIKTKSQLGEFLEVYDSALEDGQTTLEFHSATVDISDSEAIDAALEKIVQKLNNSSGKPPKPKPEVTRPQLVVDVDLNDNSIDFTKELNERIEYVLYKESIHWTNYQKNPYSYQERGIRWLLGLACHTFKLPEDELSKYGALLADDMGLGKTFMTLVAMAEYLKQGEFHDDKTRPVLVVAPLSLLDNWETEISETYVPGSSPFTEIVRLQAKGDLARFRAKPREIQLSANDDDEQATIRKVLKIGSEYGSDRLDQPRRLVLTTYETLRDYQFSLCLVDWSIVVFDEAQMVKNPNTLASRAAKGLKSHFKLILTGTPVENSLRDFWNLLDTAEPGHLDAYQQFNREFIRPIVRAEKTVREEQRQKTGRALRAKVGALMLRREKADELDGLPRKTIYSGTEDDTSNAEYYEPLQCTMPPKQAEVYNMVVANVNDLRAGDDGGNPFLAGLHKLRSVALHPQLLDGGILPDPQDVGEAEQLISQSSKLTCVVSLLRSIQDKGEKVIVFAITKKLQRFLSAAFRLIFDVQVHIINGDTETNARHSATLTRTRMIDSFQKEPGFGVIIMSPLAAGVGLTITAANHVIHLERHWNPAKEAQATDRVYRIGQQKDVFVYLPVLHHPDPGIKTFDQNLNRLLHQKSALKDAVVTPEDIRPDELMEGVFTQLKGKATISLTATDIDTLGWERFEAFCAVLMGKVLDARQTQLTLTSKDHGCDVVLRGQQNALIQCKFSQHPERGYDSEDIVKEISWARTKYEPAIGEAFGDLFAVSNVRRFGGRVKQSSKQAKVQLVDYQQLVKWLKKHPVTLNEVHQKLSSARLRIS